MLIRTLMRALKMISCVNYTTAYNALQSRYQELPWYKKIGLWLTAPMLAWDLFGYNQRPTVSRINQFITWVSVSWFFQSTFKEICNFRVLPQASTLSDNSTVRKVAPFLDAEEKQALASTSRHHTSIIYADPYDETLRNKKITLKLLHAVAYGMESRDVNVNPKPNDLFAKDLLKRSPEFLLERAHLKDWAGRTFKGRITEAYPEGEGITAFEYALWAKDFKMLEMMLACIPQGEAGNEIRAGLLEQYKQVKAPIYAGGGLTYELTYDRPTQDINGIPIKGETSTWQTTPVTEVHTENHFNLKPLMDAYQDYEDKFDAPGWTWDHRDACWIKIIGSLQRLLPIHILQRYCDPDTPFAPTPSFTDVFKRTTQFFNYLHGHMEALLSSSLSTDFSLVRGGMEGAAVRGAERAWRCADLAAVRQVDEVSTSEIETKIKRLLTASARSQTQFRC